MPSPFPGMDPYLEHPDFWPGIHNLLISEIARFLSPQLRPKYRVAVEVRMYETSGESSVSVGIPDITVQPLANASSPSMPNVAVLSPPTQPVTVTIPVPEIIKEAYLEITILRTVFKQPKYHKTRLKEDWDGLKSNPGLNLTCQ